MASSVCGQGGVSSGQLIRTFERLFEDAQITGELKLSNKKLKEFPKVACKYDLSDTVRVDLSKNRFSEVPSDVCEFYLLEKLDCYHNAIRSIPDSVITLHTLTYLDISRNQLTFIPPVLCQLPLEVLVLSNNKLVSIPEEIGHMQCLMDLDISCNDIVVIPPQIADLHSLCTLNMRRNLITTLPSELCELHLIHLDISANRIAILPTSLRLMVSLQTLTVDQNPLTSPPAILCTRGKVHIFKYLELQANKEDKRQEVLLENDFKRLYRKPGYLTDFRFHNGLISENKIKRYTGDSGYNTSDGGEKRRSQEIQDLNIDLEEVRKSPRTAENTNDKYYNKSNNIHNSFLLNEHGQDVSNIFNIKHEQNARNEKYYMLYMNGKSQIDSKDTNRAANYKDSPDKKCNSGTKVFTVDGNTTDEESKQGSPTISGESKRPYPHIQTYKEFKEALKLQRAGDNNIYKKVAIDGIMSSVKSEGVKVENNLNSSLPSHLTPEEEFRIKHETLMNQQRHEAAIIQRHLESEKSKCKPAYTESSASSVQNSSSQTMLISKQTTIRRDKSSSETSNSASNMSLLENNTYTDLIHPHFTMRRELDKAKEEQELIGQLREIMETKLKITLPEDLGLALMDGVLLCRLANYLCPNSVASVHVPSISVPKLTMAKCRKNVESFLEACQSTGVPQEQLFKWEDLQELRLIKVAHAVQALLRTTRKQSPSTTADLVFSYFLLVVFIGTCWLLYFHHP